MIPETLVELVAALEAILFVSHEPLSLEDLARITGWDEERVRNALELLDARMKEADRGLCLLWAAGGVQLATKARFAAVVAAVEKTKPPAPLSRAQLETLAIVAYRQPVTRAEIEHVRGVRSESALQALLERGLVEEAGRADGPGRPILYRTTNLFLQWCGLNSLEDLPPLPEAESPHSLPGTGSD
ncbi:MAG: SMC-Scp complex subunit ScpB [Firmicutes bacterium]|nr:SMC-Scp complex subunit ScpB [Bacillota bacterium]